MKRISVIHLILVVGTLILCSSKLNGMQSNVEMIPYRLVPSMDIECPIHIEIIHPISMLGVPLIRPTSKGLKGSAISTNAAASS